MKWILEWKIIKLLKLHFFIYKQWNHVYNYNVKASIFFSSSFNFEIIVITEFTFWIMRIADHSKIDKLIFDVEKFTNSHILFAKALILIILIYFFQSLKSIKMMMMYWTEIEIWLFNMFLSAEKEFDN